MRSFPDWGTRRGRIIKGHPADVHLSFKGRAFCASLARRVNGNTYEEDICRDAVPGSWFCTDTHRWCISSWAPSRCTARPLNRRNQAMMLKDSRKGRVREVPEMWGSRRTRETHGFVEENVVRLASAEALVPVAVTVRHKEKTFQRVSTRGANLEVSRERTCVQEGSTGKCNWLLHLSTAKIDLIYATHLICASNLRH